MMSGAWNLRGDLEWWQHNTASLWRCRRVDMVCRMGRMRLLRVRSLTRCIGGLACRCSSPPLVPMGLRVVHLRLIIMVRLAMWLLRLMWGHWLRRSSLSSRHIMCLRPWIR